MIIEKIIIILNNLPLRKASRPDGIPNEVLKALSPIIRRDLIIIINKAFLRKELPFNFKELTTIIIRKEDKKNYSLPTSYRPIILKNILTKVVKKVFTIYLNKAVKERALLP